MSFNFYSEDVLERNSKMIRRRRQCSQICLLLSGILLIGLGVSIFIFFESIFELILKEALKFAPSSPTYKAWRTNDPPLIMDMYLFNWTNPDQVTDLSVKPKFEEIGPYRFKEIKEKVNITWHDNFTVSYLHNHSYYFDEENSVRNLSDVISTINAVPLSVSYKARHLGYWTKRFISVGLSAVSKINIRKTAREILVDGYDDPILSTLSNFPTLNVQDKFGIFYGKNGVIGHDGIFSMSYLNDENFGRIISWNYRNQTNYFEGHCNDIKGSAGEFYPINRKKDHLLLYSSELCKYAYLEYDGDVIIKGVRGYRFTADYIFDNGSTRPDNVCFCKGECIPSGVFNVSACRQNTPTFLSFPHFLGADPYYTNAIKGMKPERSKHEFFITIEPKSGVVMDITVTMQVNMLLQPVKHISLYAKVPKIFVPLLYFTQKVNLTDETAGSLRLVQNFPEYANYTIVILVVLGCFSIAWAMCSWFCCTTIKVKFTINGNTPNDSHYEEVPMSVKQ